jgi:hypothetical protein
METMQTRRQGVGLTAALAAVAILALAETAAAQARLEGVWAVSIQRRDCQTTAPLGPPVRALVTFDQGNTVTETNGALAFSPGQRSIGHGTWSQTGGATFTDRTATMLLFDTAANTPPGSPGFQAGWEVTSHTITLSGDSFTATGTAQFFNLNREVYRSACVSRSGERFK